MARFGEARRIKSSLLLLAVALLVGGCAGARPAAPRVGDVRAVAYTKDARGVFMTAAVGDKNRLALYRSDIDGTRLEEIARGSYSGLSVSPSGDRLLALPVDTGRVAAEPAVGTTVFDARGAKRPVTVAADEPVTTRFWIASSDRLLYATATGIFAYDAAANRTSTVLTGPYVPLAASDDGVWLVFAGKSAGGPAGLWLFNLRTGRARLLRAGDERIEAAAFGRAAIYYAISNQDAYELRWLNLQTLESTRIKRGAGVIPALRYVGKKNSLLFAVSAGAGPQDVFLYHAARKKAIRQLIGVTAWDYSAAKDKFIWVEPAAPSDLKEKSAN